MKKCANCGREIEYTGALPTLCQLCWNKLHGREAEGMGDEKKTPLEDLLKSLEGHVVDSVEIRNEHLLVCEGNEGDILHVRISATELDPKYALHETLDTKNLSFSILEADFLSRILNWVAGRVQDSRQLFKKKKEVSITKDLTFSLTGIHKLLDHIKGTITETLRIRKPVEKKEETDD